MVNKTERDTEIIIASIARAQEQIRQDIKTGKVPMNILPPCLLNDGVMECYITKVLALIKISHSIPSN